MSIHSLEKESPNSWYYHMRDKLWQYTYDKSLKAWKQAELHRKEINDVEALANYADFMRKSFIENIGGIPYDEESPLESKIIGKIEEKELTIEKLIYISRKNVYVTANLYIPYKRSEKCGAVLFLCGHSPLGKAAPAYQNVCRLIASTGLVVMAIDPIGQGERCSYVEKDLTKPMIESTVPDHIYSGNQCFLNGISPIRFFVADAMRAIDYLVSRPEIDPEKIGVTGASGGGTLTCHMMICDPRIKAAAPAAYITDRKAMFNTGRVQDAEQIWLNSALFGFDYHEIMACFAPKPCVILTDTYDFFPIEGAKRVFNDTMKFWKMHQKEANFRFVESDTPHGYAPKLAKASAEFFAEVLENKNVSVEYKNEEIDSSLLNCTKTGQVALDYPDSKFVFDENLEVYKLGYLKKNISKKEYISEKISFGRSNIEVVPKCIDIKYENGLEVTQIMWFSEPDLPNSAYLFKRYDCTKICNMTVILADNGTEDIERYIFEIRRLTDKNTGVMLVNLSGMGATLPYPGNDYWLEKEDYGILDVIGKNMFFLGDSLCALNLYEIKQLKKLITKYYCRDIQFISSGRMSNLCELYNEYEEIDITYDGYYENFEHIIQSKYYENYNIARVILPGIVNYNKE